MLNTLKTAGKSLTLEGLSKARKPFGKRQFAKAMSDTANPRLNVGAGPQALDGWINTDIHWKSRYYLDLLAPWPVAAGSVSSIYADNLIEHFTLEEVRQILKSAFVALSPDGVIRLATPDVERGRPGVSG